MLNFNGPEKYILFNISHFAELFKKQYLLDIDICDIKEIAQNNDIIQILKDANILYPYIRFYTICNQDFYAVIFYENKVYLQKLLKTPEVENILQPYEYFYLNEISRLVNSYLNSKILYDGNRIKINYYKNIDCCYIYSHSYSSKIHNILNLYIPIDGFEIIITCNVITFNGTIIKISFTKNVDNFFNKSVKQYTYVYPFNKIEDNGDIEVNINYLSLTPVPKCPIPPNQAVDNLDDINYLSLTPVPGYSIPNQTVDKLFKLIEENFNQPANSLFDDDSIERYSFDDFSTDDFIKLYKKHTDDSIINLDLNNYKVEQIYSNLTNKLKDALLIPNKIRFFKVYNNNKQYFFAVIFDKNNPYIQILEKVSNFENKLQPYEDFYLMKLSNYLESCYFNQNNDLNIFCYYENIKCSINKKPSLLYSFVEISSVLKLYVNVNGLFVLPISANIRSINGKISNFTFFKELDTYIT